MKIVQINSCYGTGSTGRIVQDIDCMLRSYGFDSLCIYAETPPIPPEYGCKIGNQIDKKLHALKTRIEGHQGYGSKMETKSILRFLDSEKPDIVHLHNIHSNYINVNLLFDYLAKENIATIITLHDAWFFTGKCTHFTIMNCEKWKKHCKDCPKNKMEVKSWFFDQSSRVFEDKAKRYKAMQKLYIVGCSKWIADCAKSSPLFESRNIRTINNGVRLDIFHELDHDDLKHRSGLSDRFVVLGFGNKWLYEDNPQMIENITKEFKNITIILIGCTKRDRKLYEKTYMSDQLRMMPYINDVNELAMEYAKADVFINLTLEDNYPTVNMESICCGTPVITYDSGGSPEMVSDGNTGYIVNKYDWDTLKKCISKIMNGQINRHFCAEYGKKIFNQEDRYLEYLDLYKEIRK